MSLLEESYYEPNIRTTAPTDPVQGSPVVVAGQDYVLTANSAQLPTYLESVTVKVAGGGGSALVDGVDYTINLRTGVLTALGGGQLNGDAAVWVALNKTGIDDIQARQLANRLKYLKAAAETIAADLVSLAATVSGLSLVPPTRQVNTGDGLSGGGDLSTNRTHTVALDGASLSKSGSGLKVNVLQTDAQHGNLGNGSLHTLATDSVQGFFGTADRQIVNTVLPWCVALDGDVTLTQASAAPAWASKSGAGSSTEFALNRDIYVGNLTLDPAGGTFFFKTNGYRVYGTGTCTVGAGIVVHNDGVAGFGNGGAGTGGPGGTLGAGVDGVTGVGAGTSPGAGTATTPIAGGVGGGGGDDTAGTGANGTGGPGTSAGTLWGLTQAISMCTQGASPALFRGGGGGGNGAQTVAGTPYAGGGGGGGGIVWMAFRKLINSGTIRANGGAGGAGSGSKVCGGGGGGGGGVVVLFVGRGSTTGTVQANPGAGGAGAMGGITGAVGIGGVGLIFMAA